MPKTVAQEKAKIESNKTNAINNMAKASGTPKTPVSVNGKSPSPDKLRQVAENSRNQQAMNRVDPSQYSKYYSNLSSTIKRNQSILSSANDYLGKKYNKNSNDLYLKQVNRILASVGNSIGEKNYDENLRQYRSYLGQLRDALQGRQKDVDKYGLDEVNLAYDVNHIGDMGEYEKYVQDLQRQVGEQKEAERKNNRSNLINAISNGIQMANSQGRVWGQAPSTVTKVDQKLLDEYDYAQKVLNIAKTQDLEAKYNSYNYEQLKKEGEKYDPNSLEGQWFADKAKEKKTLKDYDKEIEAKEAELAELNAPTWGVIGQEYNSQTGETTDIYGRIKGETKWGVIGQEYNSQTGETYDIYGDVNATAIRNAENELENLNADKLAFEKVSGIESVKSNKDFAEKAKAGDTKYSLSDRNIDRVYKYINGEDFGEIRQHNDSIGGFTLMQLNQLTDDERQVFSYYYNLGEKDVAKEYLAFKKYDLDQREANIVLQRAVEFADEHGGLASAGSVPLSLVSGVGILDIAGQNIARDLGLKRGDQRINYNTNAVMAGKMNTAIRGTVAQNLADKYGTINIDPKEHPMWAEFLNGKSLGDVYQLGMSTVDSMVAGLIGNVTGIDATASVLLGGSAGTQGVLDALERGATDDQALTMGLINGAFETIFEYVSLDKLIHPSGNFVGDMLAQMFTEGTEEFNTSLANQFADYFVMGEKSEFVQKVKQLMDEKGLEEHVAMKEAWHELGKDMIWDFIGGAVMGGVSSGAWNSIGNISNRVYGNMAFKGDIGSVISQGQAVKATRDQQNYSYDAFDVTEQLDELQRKSDAGEKITNKEVNDILEKIQSAQDREVRKAITSSGDLTDSEADQVERAVQQKKASQNILEDERLKKAYQSGMRAYGDMLSLYAEAQGYKAENARIEKEKAEGKEVKNPEKFTTREQQAEHLGSRAEYFKQTKNISRSLPIAISNDALVNVSGIKTENGKTVVTYSDGTQSDIQDARWYNQRTGEEISRFAKTFGSDALDVYSVYKNTKYSIEAFNNLAERIISVAKNSNLSYEQGIQSINSEISGELTELQKRNLWEIGRKTEIRKAQVKKNKALKGVKIYTGDVVVDGETYKGATDLDKNIRDLAEGITAFSKDLSFAFYHGGESAVYGAYKDGVVYINVDAKGKDGKTLVTYTMSHELTHYIQQYNNEDYNALKAFVIDKLSQKTGMSLEEMIMAKQKRESGTRHISADEALDEVVADGCEMMLLNSDILSDLAQKNRSLFDRIIDHVKEWLNRLRGELNPRHEEAKELMKYADELQKMWDEALKKALTRKGRVSSAENSGIVRVAEESTEGIADNGGQLLIQEIGETGKYYVKADRQVLGNDPSKWGKEIEGYINDTIRQNTDIVIPTSDGHALILTERTAYKLSDNHASAIGKAVRKILPEAEFARKGRIATHIDELIQVARFKGYEEDLKNKHENDIGEDGFNYYESFFEDFDGKYYLIPLSAGLNGENETAYSIGKPVKRKFPTSTGSFSHMGGDAQNGEESSKGIIYTSEDKSQEIKTAIQLAFEKALAEKEARSKEGQLSHASDEIQFAMEDTVEQTDRLVAIHNKTMSGLARMVENGGVPFASVAIKKAGTNHDGFGDVSIVLSRDSIDPELNKWNEIYSNDAWTPTQPREEYEVSDKQIDELRDQVREAIGKPLYDALINRYGGLTKENLENRLMGNGDLYGALNELVALRAMYLQEKGRLNEVSEITEVEEPLDGSGKYQNEQIIAVANELPNVLELKYNDDLQPIVDILNRNVLEQSVAKGAERSKAEKLIKDHPPYEKGRINLRYIQDGVTRYRNEGIRTVPDGNNLASDLSDLKPDDPHLEGYNQWLREKIPESIITNRGFRNDKDLYTRSGNRRSWNELHTKYTMENVVAYMRQQQKTGVGALGSINLRGATTKNYKTVEEARADSGRLLGEHITDDVYKGIMKGFYERLHEMVDTLGYKRLSEYDTKEQIILETIRDCQTKSAMQKKMKSEAQWLGTVTQNLVDDVWQLKQDAQNMPAPYFEAKLRRVLTVDEPLAYIIPESQGQSDTANKLRDQGANVLTYKDGDSADRLDKVNSVEGARFSTADVEVQDEEDYNNGIKYEGSTKNGRENSELGRYQRLAQRMELHLKESNFSREDRLNGREIVQKQGEFKNQTRKTQWEIEQALSKDDIWLRLIASDKEKSSGHKTRPIEMAWNMMGTEEVEMLYDLDVPELTKALDGLYLKATKTEANKGKTWKPEEVRETATEYFGTTENLQEAGYITAKGDFLDFSGRKYGIEIKDIERAVAHDEVGDAFGFEYGADKAVNGMSGAMIQFMNDGNIRTIPEGKGIELIAKPTREQKYAIQDFASFINGKFYVDIDDADGNNVWHKEYSDSKTQAEGITTDIEKFFDSRETQFSRADVDLTEDELNEALVNEDYETAERIARNDASISKKALRDDLLNRFHIPEGRVKEFGDKINKFADDIVENGSVNTAWERELLKELYDAGRIKVAGNEYYKTILEDHLRGRYIFVPDAVKKEFSGDYKRVRFQLLRFGVNLTNDERYSSVDSLAREMTEMFPRIFRADSTDEKELIETMLRIFEEAQDKTMTFDEYSRSEYSEGMSREDVIESMERETDYAIRAYREKAELEYFLKNKLAGKLTAEDELKLRQRAREAERRGRELEKALEKSQETYSRERARAEEQIEFYKFQLKQRPVGEDGKPVDRRAKLKDVKKFANDLLSAPIWQNIQAKDAYRGIQEVANLYLRDAPITDIFDKAYDVAVELIATSDTYSEDGMGEKFRLALAREITEGIPNADIRDEYSAMERMQKKLQKQKLTNKELKEHYRELQKKQADRRKATKYRQQILKLQEKAVQMIQKPKPNQYIPTNLMRAVSEMCDIVAQAETRFYNRKIDKLEEAYKDSTAEDRDRIQLRERQLNRVLDKLSEIRRQYSSIQSNELYEYTFDNEVKDMLDTLEQTLNGQTLSDLESEKIKEVYDVMSALMKSVSESNKATALGKEATILDTAKEWAEEMNDAMVIKDDALRRYLQKQADPDVMFNYLGGFKGKDSVPSRLQLMFVDSMRRYIDVKREFYDTFQDLIETKEWKKMMYQPTKELVDWGLKDSDGNAVATSRAMMLSAYKLLKQDDSFESLAKAGFQIPKMKEFYKDDMQGAFGGAEESRFYSQSHRNEMMDIVKRLRELDEQEKNLDKTDPNFQSQSLSIEAQRKAELRQWGKYYEEECTKLTELMRNIEKEMTPFEKEFIKRTEQWYEHTNDLRNEVNLSMYGFVKEGVRNYTPIHRDLDQVNIDMRADNFDAPRNLENLGLNKERVKSPAPIQLTDINFDLTQSLEGIARFYGFTEAQRTFNKIWNAKIAGTNNTIKGKVGDIFGKGNNALTVSAQQYVNNYIKAIAGSNYSREAVLGKLYGHVARASLTLNLRVAVSQLASIPTASAYLGWGAVIKGMGKGLEYAFSTKLKEELAEKSEYFWFRYKGDGGMPEYVEASKGAGVVDRLYARVQNTKVGHALLDWCKIMDCMATSMMYPMAEAYVDDHFSLSGEEREAKIKEVYEETLRKTQPNYTETERSDLLRDKREGMRIFTMFKTQSNKNLNILMEANGELRRVARDFKQGRASATQLREARVKMANGLTSVILGGGLAFATFRMIANFILGTLSGYRDDDDELTFQSIMQGLGKEWLSSLFGNFMGGSEIYDFVYSKVSGEKYYGISDNAMGAISDLLKAGADLKVTPDEEGSFDEVIKSWDNFVFQLCDFAGIPLGNARKIVDAGNMWANDIRNGTFGQFEGNIDRSAKQDYNRMLKAILNNDPEKASEIYAMLYNAEAEKQYDEWHTQDQMDKNVLNRVKAWYTSGEIDEATARQILDEYTELKEDEIYDALAEYAGIIETGYSWSEIKEAYNANEITDDELKAYMRDYRLMDEDDIEDALTNQKGIRDTGYSYSDIKEAYLEGAVNEKQVRDYMAKYRGMKAENIETSMRDLKSEKETGVQYSEAKYAFYNGELSKSEVTYMLTHYGNMSSEDAKEKADIWEFRKNNPKWREEATDTAIKEYFTVKGKISADKFMPFYKAHQDLPSDKDANGKTISGSKKKKVLLWLMQNGYTLEEAVLLHNLKWSQSKVYEVYDLYGK